MSQKYFFKVLCYLNTNSFCWQKRLLKYIKMLATSTEAWHVPDIFPQGWSLVLPTGLPACLHRNINRQGCQGHLSFELKLILIRPSTSHLHPSTSSWSSRIFRNSPPHHTHRPTSGSRAREGKWKNHISLDITGQAYFHTLHDTGPYF